VSVGHPNLWLAGVFAPMPDDLTSFDTILTVMKEVESRLRAEADKMRIRPDEGRTGVKSKRLL